MKKASLFLLIITLLFGSFTGGLFIGRNFGNDPVQLSGTPATAPTSETEPTGTADQTESVTVVDLNSATLEELETLPGIGPVLAQRILAYRESNGPFEDSSELANVEGIGEKRLTAIMDYICIGGQYENSGS